MEKICYKIGEVAGMLGENVSAIRFWADTFPEYIRPERNAKGNRLFSREDLENIKLIHYLIKEQGMTLEGVRRRLEQNKFGLDRKMEIVERLRSIRERLCEISDEI